MDLIEFSTEGSLVSVRIQQVIEFAAFLIRFPSLVVLGSSQKRLMARCCTWIVRITPCCWTVRKKDGLIRS